MSQTSMQKKALCVAVLSLAFAAGAFAQGTPPAPARMGTAASSAGMEKAMSSADRKFVENAAIGGMYEVELGNVAQQKATNEQVKQFGARMVTDHTKANDELKQVASAKGIELPAKLDKKHQQEIDKLQKLSGATFDRDYMRNMVSDHKHDIADFEKEAKSGKDSDVKNFAVDDLADLEGTPADGRDHREGPEGQQGLVGRHAAVSPQPEASPPRTPARCRSQAQRLTNDNGPMTDDDIYLFREGTHARLYEQLGCHLRADGGGAHFAVWAPNARAVSVIGDWNGWNAGADALTPRGDGSGIWEGRRRRRRATARPTSTAIARAHDGYVRRQGRPVRLLRRGAAGHRLARLVARLRVGRRRLDGRRARAQQRARRADVRSTRCTWARGGAQRRRSCSATASWRSALADYVRRAWASRTSS